MKVGTAWPAFFCIQDGNLKGVCHGDDFCLVARRKQLQILGKVLEKRFEMKQAELTRCSAEGAEELQILSQTIKTDLPNDKNDFGS